MPKCSNKCLQCLRHFNFEMLSHTQLKIICFHYKMKGFFFFIVVYWIPTQYIRVRGGGIKGFPPLSSLPYKPLSSLGIMHGETFSFPQPSHYSSVWHIAKIS